MGKREREKEGKGERVKKQRKRSKRKEKRERERESIPIYSVLFVSGNLVRCTDVPWRKALLW